MKIGAQLYTVRQYTQTDADIEETFKKIAGIGYTCVQVSGIGKIPPRRLAGISAESGLDIAVTHTDPERVLRDTANVIEEHMLWGCGYVGIGYMPVQYRGSLEGCRTFISDFDQVARMMAHKGIKLVYHNHAFDFERFGGKTVFDVLVEETAPDRWGFIPDTYWITVGGRCPAGQIEALAGRAEICHFKDMAISGGKQVMTPVMEGNMLWEEIFAACLKAGVGCAMVEQDDTYGTDPFEALKISYNNLKKAGFS
ncbi:MAG: sugar phosphate isomerase/epimerase [Deltaproteobacteria bacterium]|nr:sugar phosphate isomerase/epimerase [Deltaproteobacteria bacterium]